MSLTKKTFFILIFAYSVCIVEGQQTPLNPVSYRIFSPFIFNPAITGSRDYSSVNLLAAFQEKATSQLIIGETRLSKTVPAYFSSPERKQFTNIGVGGALFNDLNGSSRNVGASVAAAYHLPVSKKALSFISFGAAFKAVQNTLEYTDSEDTVLSQPSKKTFFPNLDLGVYYYGTNFYAGLSTTNLLGNPEDADSLGMYEIPVSQQYFIHTGYKILLHRALNIVLEPSVIVASSDSGFNNFSACIHPLIKLYLKDFCIGTYFKDKETNSFFFQYRYPGFYLGAYFGFPKNSAYYIKEPVIEITAGISLPGKKSGSSGHSRW